MVAGLESERKERYDAVSTLLSGFMELVQSGVLSASFLLVGVFDINGHLSYITCIK